MKGDVDNFYQEMGKHEDHFKKLYQKLPAAGKKLKFVAKYENGKASVGLQHIDPNHDFYHLYGKDNVVLILYKSLYRTTIGSKGRRGRSGSNCIGRICRYYQEPP